MHCSCVRAAAPTPKPIVWITSFASAAASARAATHGSLAQVSCPSLTSTTMRSPLSSAAMSCAAAVSAKVIGV